MLISTARFTLTAPLVDLDGASGLAQERGHQLLVRRPVGLDPGLSRRRPTRPGPRCGRGRSCGCPVASGPARALSVGRGARRQPLVLERPDHLVHGRVEVQVAVDDLLHARDDRGLHVRVAGQRCHGREVPVGVLDLAARPGRQHRQRRQQGGDRDEQAGHDRSPPAASVAGGRRLLRLLEPRDLLPEPGHLLGGRVGASGQPGQSWSWFTVRRETAPWRHPWRVTRRAPRRQKVRPVSATCRRIESLHVESRLRDPRGGRGARAACWRTSKGSRCRSTLPGPRSMPCWPTRPSCTDSSTPCAAEASCSSTSAGKRSTTWRRTPLPSRNSHPSIPQPWLSGWPRPSLHLR